MRIKLEKGKQKELIREAKEKSSWEALAKILNLSPNYLRLDVLNERVLLSEKNYKQLCKIIDKNLDENIIEKLEDGWGKSKGGINSPGSKIKLIVPKKEERLAEFIGAVLGDGNLTYYKKGKKIGVYYIKIAGDYQKDKDYHLSHLKPLSEAIFNLKVKEIKNPLHGERFLALYSKELVEFFIKMGIHPGNKITNQSTIPKWIFEKDAYIQACLRGLIDTDGSICRMSNKDYNLLRINFVNHDNQLLRDTREAFIKLDFHPSKIICNRSFNLSRQEEIKRYVKEIGFKNPKHIFRLSKFKTAP